MTAKAGGNGPTPGRPDFGPQTASTGGWEQTNGPGRLPLAGPGPPTLGAKKARHCGPRSGHPARITAQKTLSWSSRATHPAWGYFLVPPVPLEEQGIEGRVPQPQGGR